MIPIKIKQIFSQISLYLIPIMGIMIVFLSFTSTALAEGSQNLINSGGNRAFLEYSTNAASLNAGIQRRTTIKVFARVGETINLGSSAVGIGSGVITYRNPSNVSATCPTTGTTGRIQTLAQEQAGPLPNVGGYNPCVVTVPAGQEGIWEIDFVSPNPTVSSGAGGNPGAIGANVAWAAQAATNWWVTAWDVTVRNAGGLTQPGRAFANYLALNMGANNVGFSAEISVLTYDGYQYSFDGNGIDPFGFVLFANNKGFKSTATTDPLYRSIQLTGANPGQLDPSISFQNPGAPDNIATRDYTHKMFFNPTGPDSTMPSSANSPTGVTWLYQDPVQPPTPTNLTFTGIEGTPNQSGTNPLGGTFSFEAPTEGPFAVTIDINDNGIYGDGNDRVLLGTSDIGTNNVFWDGRDGNGLAIPPSNLGYRTAVNLFAGEIHFPVIDPENNPNGIIIERLRDFGGNPSATPDPFQIFYDDSYSWTGSGTYDFSLCAAGADAAIVPQPTTTPATAPICYGIPPAPRRALSGISSSGGAHSWSNTFGDRRGIDTWAYYPSLFVDLPGRLTVKSADLFVTKTDGRTTISPGANTTYTIVVGNNGPSDSGLATFQDTIPAIVTNVTWSCNASAGSSCGATPNGVGSVINVNDINILNGGSLTYTVQGIIDPATPPATVITNTARVLRSNDVTDPDDPNRTGAGNNSATDTTAVTPVQAFKSVKLTTDNAPTGLNSGDRITWSIFYTNTGATDVVNFQVTDALPAGVTTTPTLTITATGTGQATPAPNGSYNGTGNNNLFSATTTLRPGGTIRIDLAVTINAGQSGIRTNQASAAIAGLAVPVLSDAVDSDSVGLPNGIIIPVDSIKQIDNPSIDPR
jgi:uncharacterized repeat protein (TIGR01451 family)